MLPDNQEKLQVLLRFLNMLPPEDEKGTQDGIFEELKYIFLSSEGIEEYDLIQLTKIANHLLFFIFFINK